MIVRGPRPSDNFAQIHNAALADGRLSFKARGILAFLLSRPPGWSTSAERLAKSGVDGERAIKTGLKELEALGYLTRKRTHKPDGTFDHTQTVTDQPTVGPKQPDGSTIGTFSTGGEAPDINNTEPITLIKDGEGVNSPSTEASSETPPPPTSITESSRDDVGLQAPADAPQGWRPGPRAMATAKANVELMDIELSITKYRIRKAEMNKPPADAEWLKWLIADEQEAITADKKERRANAQERPWWE
jgi:hypothetical protein